MMDYALPSYDAWDFSGSMSSTAQAAITGDAGSSFNVYPPAPSGSAPSDALGIFNTIGASLFSVAKTVRDFQTAKIQTDAAANIAQINAKTQAQLAQINAQKAIAQAQNPGGNLMLVLMIVGIGLAFMQYAK